MCWGLCAPGPRAILTAISTAMNLDINPPLPQRRDFRIGIVGSGFIVNECHLVAYRRAGFNPVALASRTRAKAAAVAARHGVPTVYDHAEQLLADPTIEVLDLAVPPSAQLDLIQRACTRGTVAGILAQKPLGINYREAWEAVRACAAAGITLAVNQNMRYDQSVRGAKALLENGTLGAPVVASIDMRGIPHWMPWQRDLGWLTLRIMSIHHLDTFRYWFGDPARIYCATRPDPRTTFPHRDGICCYILEYPGGLLCTALDDPWTGPAKEGCPADTRIRWRIEGLNGLALGDLGWCKEPYTTPSTLCYAAKGYAGFECPTWPESWFPDAFGGTMGQLLIALETGTEPVISGRDNLRTMALVEAAYLSAERKRAVTLEDVEGGIAAPTRPTPLAASPARPLVGGGPAVEAAGAALPPFTPRAHQALALARRQAAELNHAFVGTEHVLLGLIALGQGVAVRVLQRMGLGLEGVRGEIIRQIGVGREPHPPGPATYTPRVKRVLVLAATEAQQLQHPAVGTEHLLLGLLQEEEGLAGRVLKRLQVDLSRARQAVLEELAGEAGGAPPPTGF